jgi:hypothetical protein
MSTIPYRTALRQVQEGRADAAWLQAEVAAGRVSAPPANTRLARVPEPAQEAVSQALTYVQSLNASEVLAECGVRVGLSIKVEGAPARRAPAKGK